MSAIEAISHRPPKDTESMDKIRKLYDERQSANAHLASGVSHPNSVWTVQQPQC